MKTILYSILFSALVLTCKNEKNLPSENNTIGIVNEKEFTVAEKIANAHGFEYWNNIKEIEFAFSVERGQPPSSKRHWKWQPKTNDITLITMVDSMYNGKKVYMPIDSTSYNRTIINTETEKVDRKFINDKFWLFIPFQMVWDEGVSISEPVRINGPVHKKELNMITILYANEGGYTPGDAYDIYYNDDYLIEEWSFRRANSPEPSISCTFENYQDFSGIKLALDHKKADQVWNLKFTDVKVTLQD